MFDVRARLMCRKPCRENVDSFWCRKRDENALKNGVENDVEKMSRKIEQLCVLKSA